ncbi:MAG: MATE family efflux transporter [Alphaproteobacteria bacterium]|nr:MAG: MATE family efflux transporter [Alphaproteobacteria bacterium]
MTSKPSREITRQKVFAIAWPIVLSNTTVPLLGLADTFVIGNQGDAALIGAIAIGAMIFSFIYWGFGFLRMGTTGLVAQAAGADDEGEVSAAVARALLLAAVIGGVLIVLQWPLRVAAFGLIDGSDAVEQGGLTYFTIRIWGAPATLASYAILGFFIGLQDSRTALVLQLFLNALNILLDVIFVMGLHWGVAGVAAGTLIAEVSAAVFGLALILRRLRRRNPEAARLWPAWPALLERSALIKTLSVNSDIMLRTLCLIFAFAWFTNQGAKAGDVALAANAVLMQFVTFSAFFLDGFAFSAESLVGQSIGEKNRRHLDLAVRYSTELAALTALAMSLLILIAGPLVIDFLTNVETVRAAAREFLPWAILAPIASVWCFQLDGIFIGATRTADMRNAMALSLIVYLMAWVWLADMWGNHGLWAALTVFYFVRAGTLYWRYPALKEESF